MGNGGWRYDQNLILHNLYVLHYILLFKSLRVSRIFLKAMNTFVLLNQNVLIKINSFQ